MSQIEGTNTDVSTDRMANTITIRLGGDPPSVTAKEVIQHLESDSLAQRTRRKLTGFKQEVIDDVEVIKLKFRGAWNYITELDVIDALRELFTKKGVACAAA